MHRRTFLSRSSTSLAAVALPSLSRPAAMESPADATSLATTGPDLPLYPIAASADRIIAMQICTRPFRAAGPRQELEKFGRKRVIHNYGHGGSGWSLSWGSADLAVAMALSTGERRVAVIGCGAIGLTTALEAQRRGLQVKIYASELPPLVRSSFATGIWSPDSRICTQEHARDYAERWETQARLSFTRYQNLLGLAGHPVEWRRIYQLSDTPFGQPSPPASEPGREPQYPALERTRLADITPHSRDLAPGQHPFPVAYARQQPLLHFNLAAYSRLLLDEFRLAGGTLEIATFGSARDFAAVDERVLINCTGYGARALLGDDSIIPVRGQTVRLIPQEEVDYGIQYGSRKFSCYPRRDGLLVQSSGPADFNNADTTIDPAESIGAVQRLAELMAGMRKQHEDIA